MIGTVTMKYNLIVEEDMVSICMDCDSSLESFIDIFTDEETCPSPFRSVDDAKLFGEIIIKLLEVINNGS